MLRTKLFRAFAILVLIFSGLSAYVAIRAIKTRIIDEAQARVRLDLRSAWHVYGSKLDGVQSVVRMAAIKEAVVETCERGSWTNLDVRVRLERIRQSFGLDFLDVLSPDGQTVLRTAAPYAVGDYRIGDPVASGALKGSATAGMTLLTRQELELEASGLAERAFLELRHTPRARKTVKEYEDRGMVMAAAAPVMRGMNVIGVVYGGTLVNRNFDLIDDIRSIVYGDEQPNGAPVGTATIFLDDVRIATTVRGEDGNRALATRASAEVADRVLDNGLAWVGDAFVVKERYLTAYEPIRDPRGGVIGMLYVGILKKPFEVYERGMVVRYLWLSLFVLFVALVLAFVESQHLAAPIHRLVEAANLMRKGQKPPPVSAGTACHETGMLIDAFNQMANTLVEREERLKALNRSYMETLGFVSHELKSPVATIINYVYLLRQQKLGPLTERQDRAIRSIDTSSKRLVEMVRHYLNLSRIENHEIHPVIARVDLNDDVLRPLLESMEVDLSARAMRVTNEVGAGVVLKADLNMVREVFENLVSNAVKYGKDGGHIVLTAVREGERYRLAVKNEGPRIPPESMGDLFQKFRRLETVPGFKGQKGTGLGLFITKSIVEAHGGRIAAVSGTDGWTEFAFDLPAESGEPAERSTEDRRPEGETA